MSERTSGASPVIFDITQMKLAVLYILTQRQERIVLLKNITLDLYISYTDKSAISVTFCNSGARLLVDLLCDGDYGVYRCIGRQSTENGIPGLWSRLPLAIYSQSKFHWSSLPNIHLKNQLTKSISKR